MKKRITLFLFAALILGSCAERDVITYGHQHNIYFDKFYMDALPPGKATADSTVASFFFVLDDENETRAELVVNMTGRLLAENVRFQLKVVPEMTTANPDEYALDDYYEFRANNVQPDAKQMSDTIRIKMFRTPRLKDLEQGVKLTLELVPNDVVQLGQFERRRAVILLTSAATRPLWWTKDVEEFLMGPYSHKKYRLFLENIDPKGELDEQLIRNRPDRVRKIVFKFKEWLEAQNPPILEDNGQPMRVNI